MINRAEWISAHKIVRALSVTDFLRVLSGPSLRPLR
jgi:hypothetical protein